ncbi:phosphate acyltransferase PlsX [Bacillota bacterium Meth-B3]
MAEYVVAVDAMGGDHAPEAPVQGAILALKRFPDLRVQLYGPASRIEELLATASDVAERIEVVDAPEVIGMHDSPTDAVRRKVNSSMVKAMLAVKEGRADAVVSAGSTGALLAGGILRVGRIPGIERPALAVVIPGRKKPFLLLDCGANVDCLPRVLALFGLMGSIYMNRVMGVESPDVRLVNIGTETEKGNRLSKDAHQLMSAQQVYRFGGNVEARDVPLGACDVVVADGFDGNLLLKYTEGLSSALMGMLKDEMMSSARAKLGALLLGPTLRAFKDKMSYEEYGGAPLLGLQGAVIKAHGSSSATAMMNALRQARTIIMGDVVNLIAEGVAGMTQDNL